MAAEATGLGSLPGGGAMLAVALSAVVLATVGPWALRPRAASAAGPVFSGPVVVHFAAAALPGDRLVALRAHGLALVDRMTGTDFVLARPAGPPVPARPLLSDPAVEDAGPPGVVRALGTFGAGDTPDDPLFATAQWHLHAVGVPEAWKVSTGVGATVAVLDTGVAYEDLPPFHRAPDLAGTRFVPGYDFVDDDPHPDDVPVPSQHTHGTHIAGTIAQTSGNGIGGAGVAPGAAIMPVRVLAPDGTGTTWATAKGLRFAADHGANVANLSLGGTAGAPELADAVSYAVSKGVTVVVASGDDGRPSLLYPAAYPDVIAVGAVRLDGTRPRYSNYGPGLALVAPGGDLQSDQNGDRLDDGIVQQTVFDEPGSFCFCFLEGTSSAAAHVSGAAALVVASGRATRPADVRTALVSTAHDLGPPGRDDDYGAGLLQIPPALGLRFDYRPPVTVTSPAGAPVPGGTDPGAGSASVTVRGGALPASPRNPPGSPADGATALALAVGVGVAAVVVGVWAISRHGQHRRGP